MRIELNPPDGAAGIAIGATRAEALDQCARLGDPGDFRRGDDENVALKVFRPTGLAVFVYFDGDDRVKAVELGRPGSDEDTVELEGVDVFGTPAADLVVRLAQSHAVETTEDGRSVTLPDLLLALGRPVLPEDEHDDEGRYFESVLVARPGYYDA